MAARYVRIGQHPDYRDEIRGTLSEILASTANPGTYAAPEDVTGTFLEMGADGLWTGASVGYLTKAQADAVLAAQATKATLKVGVPAQVDGVQYTWRGAGSGGWVQSASMLMPSGYDQTSEIQQFLMDYRNNQSAIQFGVGDFVLNDQILIYSQRVNSDENDMGYGQSIFGSGPEYTRFLDVRADKSNPVMYITEPTDIDVGRRYEMSRIGGFSLLSCSTNGTPISLSAPPSGVGIMAKATSGSGFGAFVYHSNRMERIRFSGHAFPLTLDDTTQFFGDELRFTHAEVAVRLGGNADIIRLRNCGFGSESGIGKNNTMVGVKSGYDFGIVPAGGSNIIDIDGAWCMAIGTVVEDVSSTQVSIRNSYFERCRRYYYANKASDASCEVQLKNCTMSFLDDQRGVASNDPASPDYVAHIQIGATGISQGSQGPMAKISVKDCTGYTESAPPANALICTNRNTPGTIAWENNSIPASASYGHVRNTRTNYQMWRTLRTPPSNASVSIRLGGDQHGLSRTSGDELEYVFTASAGSNNVFSYLGEKQFITLPDADCTLASPGWSATLPNYATSPGEEITLHIKVPGTVTGTRTLTFVNMRGVSTLIYSASDVNKVAVLKLRAMAANSNVMQAINTPAFYSV